MSPIAYAWAIILGVFVALMLLVFHPNASKIPTDNLVPNDTENLTLYSQTMLLDKWNTYEKHCYPHRSQLISEMFRRYDIMNRPYSEVIAIFGQNDNAKFTNRSDSSLLLYQLTCNTFRPEVLEISFVEHRVDKVVIVPKPLL